ncbi:MAG: LemA family protein [Elusimicrobiota bacterium]|nr:LemA family protein [Elusimicrobiota bacterium]
MKLSSYPDAETLLPAFTGFNPTGIIMPFCALLLIMLLAESFAAGDFGGSRFSAWLEINLALFRAASLSALLLLFAGRMVGYYNLDMHDLNLLAEKKAQIRTEFQRSEDLGAGLFAAAERYARHEQVLFSHVSEMRARLQHLEALGGKPSPAQLMKTGQVFSSLEALVEQYPELKAEGGFRELMDAAELSENRIADGIKDYSAIIYSYNVGNQGYWNNCFLYPFSNVLPLPSYWEYYYAERTGAPLVPLENISAGSGGKGV